MENSKGVIIDKLGDCVQVKGLTDYFVSPEGRVFKLTEVSTYDNGSGYEYIKLNGGKVCTSVHRLVAENFLEKSDTHSDTVDHIDGNKKNNNKKNLMWMPLADNIRKHFSKERSFLSPEGEVCVVHNIRKFAREKGLDSSALSKVARGKFNSTKGWRVFHGNRD